MEEIFMKVRELFALFGLKIIAAILILVLGRWVAQLIRSITEKLMKKSKIDNTIVSFVGNLLYVILLVFVIIAALGQLGIQTTSLIAIIGAAGLAVGLALQGSLANFAAGILMIIFRPLKVGDFIEGAGISGVVDEIQIFTTKLKTLDNKIAIIPNAKLTEDNIINYSAKEIRRVDLVFGVSYSDDIDKVKKVISDVLSKDERILKDPQATIGVLELADSSVNFAVRPWVKTPDYWNVYFGVTESIKKAFDSQDITIPFPQRGVHLYKEE